MRVHLPVIGALSACLILGIAGGPAAAEDSLFPAEKPAAEREKDRLAFYGIAPISTLAQKGRVLRRVTYADIYKNPGLPAVTIEKKADGQIEMTVASFGGKVIDTLELKPEAWALIAKQDRGLAPRGNFKPPSLACVGASVVVEAVDNGAVSRREGEVCNGAPDAATMALARAMADVAVKSIPRCAGYVEHARDPSWTLRVCTRRALVPQYNRTGEGVVDDYFGSQATNGAVFESYALKASNNVTPEVVKQISAGAVDYDGM